MKSFNVAIVKPNDFNRHAYGLDTTREQLDQLISPLVEYVETTANDMMELIVTTIGLTKDMMGATNIFYQDKDAVYQLCYIDMQDNEQNDELDDKKNNKKKEDTRPINGLSSSFSMDNLEIRGNVVLIRSDITDNYVCTTSSISPSDLTNIMYKKCIHKGVKVQPDGQLTEFYFMNDPLEGCTKEEVENYQWMEFHLFKLNFLIFIQKNPEPNQINKTMTHLLGTNVIHGTSLIVLKSNEKEYLDVDLSLFKDLLAATYGPFKHRALIGYETRDGEQVGELPMVVNGYRILDKRARDYKCKCESCGVNIVNFEGRCCGCYRVFYHTKECQKKDWHYHKEECLMNSAPMHLQFVKSETEVVSN
jgi:hypothetical protein